MTKDEQDGKTQAAQAGIEADCAQIAAGFAQLATLSPQIAQAAQRIIDSLAAGGKALFCGNGGSAADSQHLAAELMGRYLRDRRPLPALALTTDTSALTAIGNDYGFEQVFARQLQGVGQKGDILVALSTSGSSENVLSAARAARDIGMVVIGMTGKDDSPLAELADLAIQVPAQRTDRIQEMHIAAGHMICGIVEEALC